MTANILVVDDLDTNIKVLEAKLLSEYYTVFTATSGIEALEILESNKIDVILLDCMMPGMDGFETCKRIKSNPDTTHIPVVIVTALSDLEDKIKGLEAGADEFLTKPVNDIELFARLKSLCRVKALIDELKLRNETNKELGVLATAEICQDFSDSKILIIDDDIVQSKYIVKILNNLTSHVKIVLNKPEVEELLCENFIPDVTIISCQLEDQDPLRLLASLKANQFINKSLIMMLSEDENIALVTKALDLGASDYLIAPIEKNELIARIKTQIRRKYYQEALRVDIQQGMDLSIRDGLSRLYNRRYFDTHLPHLLDKSRTCGQHVYAMMVDIDHFKLINDIYGHLAGDIVIHEIANILKISLRANDFVARYGGEEFIVVLSDVQLSYIKGIAERIKSMIESYDFVLDNNLIIKCTVSIGVSKYNDLDDISSFLTRVDRALYESKNLGRNAISFKNSDF